LVTARAGTLKTSGTRFSRAVPKKIMNEWVGALTRDFRVLPDIHCGIEGWIWVPPFMRAGFKVVAQRVQFRRRHVGILSQIPGTVK
jgi:hypothetical protein